MGPCIHHHDGHQHGHHPALLLKLALAWTCATARLVHAKGGGGGGGAPAPPPPELFIDHDTRELCDPCAELWHERTSDTSYAGMDLRQIPHYGATEHMLTPIPGSGAATLHAYGYGQNELWGPGYNSRGSTEFCNDVVTGSGQPLTFQVGCAVKAEGTAVSPDAPVYCEAGEDLTRVRTLTCGETDPGDGTASPRFVPGTSDYGAYLLPCDTAVLSNGLEAYTPLQACCRCGGGTYVDVAPAPPAPPPPLGSAEAMCTALPGCCYSASAPTCGQSSVGTYWDNGKKVSGAPAVTLTGCCFSPEWREALVGGQARGRPTTPEHWRYTRFVSPEGDPEGPDSYPDATCSAAETWPVYTPADEPIGFWMRDVGSNEPISGVSLVFCKNQGAQAHAPGWGWYDVAGAAGSPLVLWILYQIFAQPITGCVWLCCQDKKAQGKEPDCPKAAGVVIGGTCLCCAPCICVMMCTGEQQNERERSHPLCGPC
eukprot:COSAG02_NODE_356_length_23978_cov_7.868504_9_plen_483_part_00